MEIGPKSQALRDEQIRRDKAYYNDPQYKKANDEFEKAADKLYRKFENGEVEDLDGELYKLEKKFMDSIPKKDKTKEIDSAYVIHGKREFDKVYLKNGGAKISVARLEDLGYDVDTAKNFVDRMARSGYTLGML